MVLKGLNVEPNSLAQCLFCPFAIVFLLKYAGFVSIHIKDRKEFSKITLSFLTWCLSQISLKL